MHAHGFSLSALYQNQGGDSGIPASQPLSNSDPKYSVEAGGQSIQHSGKK